MEHLKARLSAIVIALFMSTATLTSVSYAWFTLTTNPEINNIIASVSANQNLEIALDDGYQSEMDVDVASSGADGLQGSTAGDPYTWGNYVDLTKAFEQEEVLLQQIKFSLEPNLTLEYPLYGEDGRIASLDTLRSKPVSDYNGKGSSGGVVFYETPSEESKNYAYSVTYWMRTNVAGEISLSEEAKRANDGSGATTGVNGVMGSGSYVTVPIAGNGTATEVDDFIGNLRVVFVDETTSNPSIVFEASIGAGVSDGTVRKYKLVTLPKDAGDNPVYVSELQNQTITLAANVAKKITMYVYIDGPEITNGDAMLYDMTGVEINVQFDNSALDDTSISGGAMTGDTAGNSAYTDGVAN